jgi:glucose-6-phosphate 1-dehydrogenase
MHTRSKTLPVIVLLFGATGDLFRKKVFPAIIEDISAKRLPPLTTFLAYGRRPFEDTDFRVFLDPKWAESSALRSFGYVSGALDSKDGYKELERRVAEAVWLWGKSNILIYLAIPPREIPKVLSGLRECGISKRARKDGFVRIMIEKPFGTTMKDARALERELARSFTDPEIFRIDHYLAKPMLSALPLFRKK